MALQLSGSLNLSGSMTATTIVVSAPGVAGIVSSSAQITELAPLMAYTASLKGAIEVSGQNVNVLGMITAQQFNVTYVSSSVMFQSGSTKFGNSGDDMHEFTGSVDVSGTGRFTGVLTLGSTISNGTYTYTLPSATGTLALTSALSGYLPLTGGTLTGALTGTSATFSGMFTSTLGNNTQIFQSSTATTGYQYWNMNNTSGQLIYGIEGSSGGSVIAGTAPYSTFIGTGAVSSAPLYLITNGVIRQTIASTGAATFTGALSGTSATFSATSTFNGTSTGVIAYFNAPTSGGTITFQTGGTSFADIGSELGNFGTGSATNLCVSARSGNNLILGGGALKTLTLASTGAATFSGTVNSNTTGRAFSTETATSVLFSNVGGAFDVLFGDGASRYYSLHTPTGAATMSIRNYSSGLDMLTFTSTGAATFSSLGTGTVTATSGTLSTTSDMNLKDEDGFIINALEKVLKLKPRYFHWKEESGLPTDLRQLGFYAQEVNQALGEEAANTPKTENDKWGIYDRGMIAFLTAAIQEQQAQIETQDAKIEELKALIAAK